METTQTSPPVVSRKSATRSEEDRKKHGRAAISNGHDLLPDIDGRSAIARRYRDITSAILIDQGGEDRCSESRKQLIRRFAAAACLAEQAEARLANGEKINIQEHALLCSTLTRLAAKIGINRIPKNVTTLDDYLGSLSGDETESEAAE
jgi:hypothetical protein